MNEPSDVQTTASDIPPRSLDGAYAIGVSKSKAGVPFGVGHVSLEFGDMCPMDGFMMFPPSLSPGVKARAFVATNGELGVLPSDTRAFLDACRADGVEMLGWELWVINHAWGKHNAPVAAAGLWCGGIPLRGETAPAVVGGSGDIRETERQIAAFDLEAEVLPQWLPDVRVNFTLDD